MKIRSYPSHLLSISMLLFTTISVHSDSTPFFNDTNETSHALTIQCSLTQKTFRTDEPVNVWCTVTNTSNTTQPIQWHPSCGVHFCLTQSRFKPWQGGVLPLPIPLIERPMLIKSHEFRPFYTLYLPPKQSMRIILSYRPDRPESFRGRVVYDPQA